MSIIGNIPKSRLMVNFGTFGNVVLRHSQRSPFFARVSHELYESNPKSQV